MLHETSTLNGNPHSSHAASVYFIDDKQLDRRHAFCTTTQTNWSAVLFNLVTPRQQG